MLAEKWGCPPWTIEQQASKYWIETAVGYYDIIGSLQSKDGKKKKSGLGTAETGHGGMKAGEAIGGTFEVQEMNNLIWPD